MYALQILEEIKNIIIISFSLVVKCKASNLRVLGSNPARGIQFLYYLYLF